ncbi:hypothetical protein BRADI_2g38015v3 [Brachypodium distachyon]|uniref:Cupin type-1 domain-containing protein n=1 Tax=Brachypodium distachyon TaxID=15368 RepID=A0A0Q3KAB9_BRADI|nr:hypothetical protein BRADI_2g38015v3 [Brachypodium distachyon]
MATTSFPSLLSYICIFLLFHGSMAQLFSQDSPWQSPRQGGFRECNFDRLQAVEPLRQVRSEAGLTEYFDEQNEQFRCTGNEQFRCTGVSVIRRVIEPRGLLLPRYHNTLGLVYIIQGTGFVGLALPGCPETFQEQFQQFGQAQPILGDVVALPAGVAHWFYNDGDVPIVAVYVFDINSNANQLEPAQKEFVLAGKYNGVLRSGQNIFKGFNSQNAERGEIIRVNDDLEFLNPVGTQQQPFQPIEAQKGQSSSYQIGQMSGASRNGLEENYCSLEPRLNIEDPSRVDTYNPHSSSVTHLNGQNFPILNIVQMSATRVNLYQNAILSPFWNINAHSVVDGPLRQGQLLIIPQNYVVLKKAEREGFQYIAFKTNANSMVSNVAGKNSILRALPVDVIANAYGISIQEAQNLKNNRGEEIGAFSPKFSQSSLQSHV